MLLNPVDTSDNSNLSVKALPQDNLKNGNIDLHIVIHPVL